MPPRTSVRAILVRAAAALRRAGAALARRARDGGGGPGRAPPPAAGAADQGDGAFLSQVEDTLLEIAAGTDGSAPAPGAAAPEAGPPAPRAGTGLRARLRRLFEPLRHHEDAVLALALLIGIAVMILHWVR